MPQRYTCAYSLSQCIDAPVCPRGVPPQAAPLASLPLGQLAGTQLAPELPAWLGLQATQVPGLMQLGSPGHAGPPPVRPLPGQGHRSIDGQLLVVLFSQASQVMLTSRQLQLNM
jgi:hypothetical protein